MESCKQNSRQYRISVFKSGLVKQSVDWGYRLLSPCNSTSSRAGEGWNGSNKKCWLAVKALAHGRRTNEGREMGKKLASETEASDRKVFWRQEPWPWNRRNQVKSGRGHSARWYFLPLQRRASGPRYTLATLASTFSRYKRTDIKSVSFIPKKVSSSQEVLYIQHPGL